MRSTLRESLERKTLACKEPLQKAAAWPEGPTGDFVKMASTDPS
jgi:hypothetical protein